MATGDSPLDLPSKTCRACRKSAVRVLLDFGSQPPSNRFESRDTRHTDTHPLVIGQCEGCGLVQLLDPMAPSMVMPRFEWLAYSEPEAHLDDLVDRISKLPGAHRDTRIVGLSYKDDSTLQRLNRLGFDNTYRYDVSRDLDLHDPRAGLESIQAILDKPMASRLVADNGTADILLVRHVLEHAHDPHQFVSALRTLVKPGGRLVFEMPDSTKFIKACDYSFVWEEHITYFTPETLAAFARSMNLVLEDGLVYPYAFEDSLIGIVRNAAGTGEIGSASQAALADGAAFSRQYRDIRARLQLTVADWRRQGERIAIFGAGHLAAKFVNLNALEDSIDCVIDDHPGKQGLLMPGSRLPIRGSDSLDDIDICLLSLNPESERKVVVRHQPFLDRGGVFLSIFALSPITVYDAGAV